MDLDERIVPGRRGQPAVGLVGQLRHRRHHARDARVIGETDFTSGPATLHPKAIYIVEATLYQVERLDFEGRKAFVREIDCDYYTDAITYTRVTLSTRSQSSSGLGRARAVARRVATAKSTSSRASSASRRSSSTRTRTSDRASWICPSSRCTRPRTG